MKRRIEELNCDTSHFGSKPKSNGGSHPTYLLDEILIENSNYANIARLKSRLVSEGRLEYKCAFCGISEWRGLPLSLHLDHENGVNNDHRIENLRFLCPNCHSQTETFTGKNKTDKEKVTFTEEQAIEALKNTPNVNQATKYIGCAEGGANWIRLKAIKNKFNIIQEDDINKPTLTEAWVRSRAKEPKLCQNCGRPLSSNRNEICQICAHEKQKRCEWPTREILKEKIRTKPFLQIGKEYNVSDNAVRKWCKSYGLPFRAKEIKDYSDEEWEKI